MLTYVSAWIIGLFWGWPISSTWFVFHFYCLFIIILRKIIILIVYLLLIILLINLNILILKFINFFFKKLN